MTSPLLADRVQETTTTTGTGTLTLGGATTGCRTFNSAFSNGNVVYYVIDDGAGNWEVGSGTVGTGTLTRDTVYVSSNAGSKVSFAAGSKTVYCDASANVFPSGNVVGTSDAQTLTNKTLTTAGSNSIEATSGPTSTQLAGHRNKIINGAMMIDQRNAGASFTVTGGNYTLDRWLAFGSVTSKYAVQQSSSAPAGFTNSLMATSISAYSVGASELFSLNQIIEGYNISDLGFGTANAKSFTISFWVNSSLTGTFTAFFANSNQSRWYIAPITIANANTWQYVTITVPGDTSGTWITNNGQGLYFSISLSAGSAFQSAASSGWSGSSTKYGITGQTSFVGTNGATFYITGVQLEKGATATPFENRLYGTELALCQRYFCKSFAQTNPPANGIEDTRYVGILAPGSGGTRTNSIFYKQTMRSNPTIAFYASSSANVAGQWAYYNSGWSTFTPSLDGTANDTSFNVFGSPSYSGIVSGSWTASAEL